MDCRKWCQATTDDLDAIDAIGNGIHLSLPERPEVFPEKLNLFPSGCCEFERKLSPVMRHHHVAGEKVFVDYSGKKIAIADPKTGE